MLRGTNKRCFALCVLLFVYTVASGGAEPQTNAIAAVRQAMMSGRSSDPVIRIHGIVTMGTRSMPEYPTAFYVQDASGGISVEANSPVVLKEGDEVIAEGRPAFGEHQEPEISSATVFKVAHTQSPAPITVSVAGVQSGAFDARLVRLTGHVAKASIGETRDAFELEDATGTLRIYVRRPVTLHSDYASRAAPGAKVEVVGIVLPASETDKKLRLRTIADLTLIERAPALTPGYIALGAAGVLLIGGIVGLWVLTLRRSIRRKTEEVQTLLARAEEASRAKSEFLATVSHEIRTPLNGVLGMQELVLATQLTPEQRNYVQEAQACTRSLLTLLNDVLDLSKIEAGRLTLAQEAFDVHQLISETLRPVQAEIVRKKLEFRNHVQSELPSVMSGDPVRLRQVLMNLLSNAVKFTDKGSITLDVAGRRTEDARVHVTFAVTDTGIGISPDHQSRIFDSFRQADGSIARRFGGTGLGLAIASRLVGMMGGKLTVESVEGAGSTFSFTITLAAVEMNPARPAELHEVAALPGRRILVVEDNAVNRKVAEVILARAGYVVESATEGHQALRLVSNSHFDAILMDVQMPDMDGLQVTRTIRTNFPEPAASVPIIALTANAMPGDVEKCIAAGMNGYVAKPFHSRELIAAIETHAAKARAATVAE